MKTLSGTFREFKFRAEFIYYETGKEKKPTIKCLLDVKKDSFLETEMNIFFQCSAVAKLNMDEGDIFDEAEGQRIALKKALLKFNKLTKQIEKRFKKIQDNIIISADDFYAKLIKVQGKKSIEPIKIVRYNKSGKKLKKPFIKKLYNENIDHIPIDSEDL
jgi:TRAP-type mannitol/chloroaromatic compound transport system substrate-binding protein